RQAAVLKWNSAFAAGRRVASSVASMYTRARPILGRGDGRYHPPPAIDDTGRPHTCLCQHRANTATGGRGRRCVRGRRAAEARPFATGLMGLWRVAHTDSV